MSRALDDLSARFKPYAFQLLARLTEAGVPVLIVGTGRTDAEQAENLRTGVSWTLRSRHLTGDAIDIAPYATYQQHGGNKLQWDGKDPVWQTLGTIGEQVGLVWGGRWKATPDLGHFEAPWPREG